MICFQKGMSKKEIVSGGWGYQYCLFILIRTWTSISILISIWILIFISWWIWIWISRVILFSIEYLLSIPYWLFPNAYWQLRCGLEIYLIRICCSLELRQGLAIKQQVVAEHHQTCRAQGCAQGDEPEAMPQQRQQAIGITYIYIVVLVIMR